MLSSFRAEEPVEASRRGRWRKVAVAVGVLAALALAFTAGLNYWRPATFSWRSTAPATLTYFSLFGAVLWCLGTRGPGAGSTPSRFRLPEWMGEFGAALMLVAVGASVGSVSGSVWWLAGGHAVRGFVEAVKMGAFLGGVLPVLLFEGL